MQIIELAWFLQLSTISISYSGYSLISIHKSLILIF